MLVNRGWVPAAWLDDIPTVAAASDAVPTLVSAPAAPSPPTPAPPARRGWFGRAAAPKADERQGAAADGKAAAAAVHVVGVLQPNEQPSRVLPDNVPSKLEFHWVDVPALVSGRAGLASRRRRCGRGISRRDDCVHD